MFPALAFSSFLSFAFTTVNKLTSSSGFNNLIKCWRHSWGRKREERKKERKNGKEKERKKKRKRWNGKVNMDRWELPTQGKKK